MSIISVEDLEDIFVVMGKWEPEFPGGWALECCSDDESMILTTGTKDEMDEMQRFIIGAIEMRM